MFPPNLQKNIKELERQISLLETECEHRNKERKQSPSTGKTTSESLGRDLPNQPFITGPSISTSSYSNRLLKLPPAAPTIYSVSCSHFKTSHEKFPRMIDVKCPADSPNSHQATSTEPNPSEDPKKACKEEGIFQEKGSNGEKKHKTEQESHKGKLLIDSIKESCEPNNFSQVPLHNSKPEPPWSEMIGDESPLDKREGGSNTQRRPTERNSSDPKVYSDEEFGKGMKLLAKNWPDEFLMFSRIAPKRRPRSSRTKRHSNEFPIPSRALFEKETQCMLWIEESGQEQFFSGLNEALKTLHLLMGQFKTKLSREKTNDVLKKMQMILLKITNMYSINSPTPLPICEEPQALQTEQSVVDVKNTLLALKQFCQQLSDEKSALTQEIAVKNRSLSNFKAKEKEYISLISSLKFSVDKLKEEAEDGSHAKNELKVIKVRLKEETKVIEALKKSHEKMQELIQNYVLENDKLRAQVKITKLESEKYNVLLAGKDAEIRKYKREIESFQKQITEQLSLLRSKAAENEVKQAIEAINNHKNIFLTEVESIGDQLEKVSNLQKDISKSTEWEIHSETSHEENQKPEMEGKSDGETSNASEIVGISNKRSFGLEKVLSSSKNLRSSINELLQDIRRESSEMYWMSPTNSFVTTSQSGLFSFSSDELIIPPK